MKFRPNNDQRHAVAGLGAQGGLSVLSGNAGTGKTTLAVELPAMLGIEYRRVLFCAPTNKAAAVLRTKLAGRAGATTVHKALYGSAPYHCFTRDCGGDEDCEHLHSASDCCAFEHVPRPFARNYDLVVCDESSMLRKDDFEELRSRDVRTILVGDPSQLRPVDEKNRAFSALQAAEGVTLSRVMRQGEGSEILDFAYAARDGAVKAWAKGSAWNGEVQRLGAVPWRSAQSVYGHADVVAIAWRNDEVAELNRSAREAYGFSGVVRPGEILIATERNRVPGVHNGAMFRVKALSRKEMRLLPLPLGGGDVVTVPRPEVVSREAAWNYGYALTCHKAQGSEWECVFVVGDWGGRDWKRWLYTASTRASDLLTLVRSGA